MQKTKTSKALGGNKSKFEIRLSKANYEFDLYSDIWMLDSNLSINFSLLNKLGLSVCFEKNFRIALADYSSEFSSHYVMIIYVYIRKLFLCGVHNRVEEKHILNFKSKLTQKSEYQLGSIKAFILDWHDKDIPGIDKKAVALLQSLKLSGNEKGKAVATGCPYSGPYTYDEQIALIKWYVDSYTDGTITLAEYAMIMGLQQTGARPIQLCRLYGGDLIRIKHPDGSVQFDLKLPDAKKRGSSFRESFQVKEFIDEDLYSLLNAQAKQSIKLVEDHFQVCLSKEQQQRIPLFLNQKEILKLSDIQYFRKIQQKTPDLFCIPLSRACFMIRKLARICHLRTSRIDLDGEFGDLHINPRRFRYTHATNLAMLGASKYVIARELGHSDTQNVDVYTEFNEEMASRIDDALAPALIPLAQAFSGTLIDSEKDAIRVNDPRSRIYSADGNSVGNCGKYGFCADGTIHCYTCNKFEPWLNGPHQEILDQLIAERERKKSMGASDFVLQSYNRSIVAIRVVLQKCEDRKEKLKCVGAING